MKHLTHILMLVVALCLPTLLAAQDDDSKYLAGAVPEVDGKVIFSKEYSIPGMSQEEIFERMNQWMESRLKKNENNSRVVYTNPEKGQIVGTGDEWIVFHSSALSLDRTRIIYQLTVTCQPEKCLFEVEKIRYIYREGEEKYNAEEWIVDKYALNKTKTKLIRGLAKWRKKTVDFVDDLCVEVAEALSATNASTATAEEKPEAVKEPEKSIATSGTTVITPRKEVTVNTPAQPQAAAPAQTTPASDNAYKEIAPAQLPADLIQMGSGKLVIVIGSDAFNMTMMTANAGGSIGKMSGKPVVFTMLSPDQPYEQMEKAENYTVRFYPNGQNEPTVVLECKKLPSQAPLEGQPRMYIGEITKAMVK